MPHFSDASIRELQTCDDKLQKVLLEAIKHIDFAVICGHRGEIDQKKAFAEKRTQLDWPKSKHNVWPSRAVDIVPYHKSAPHVDWSDKEGFIYLAGVVMGIAAYMGIKLRWGGDWDCDCDQRDEKFRDLPHFEVVE